MVSGDLQFTILLVWDVDMVSIGKTNNNAFFLEGDINAQNENELENV